MSMRQRGKEEESSAPFLPSDPEFRSQADRRERRRSRQYLVLVLVAGIALVCSVALVVGFWIEYWVESGGEELPSDPYERALAILNKYPVIDG